MYEVFIKTHFSSAHFLRNYPGNCEHLHGHNWEVRVAVRAGSLNGIDVAIDFRDLKRIVGQIMSELDHINLNDHPAFQDHNPSSERIAEYIYDRVKEELGSFPHVSMASVTVCETPKSGVTFSED